MNQYMKFLDWGILFSQVVIIILIFSGDLRFGFGLIDLVFILIALIMCILNFIILIVRAFKNQSQKQHSIIHTFFFGTITLLLIYFTTFGSGYIKRQKYTEEELSDYIENYNIVDSKKYTGEKSTLVYLYFDNGGFSSSSAYLYKNNDDQYYHRVSNELTSKIEWPLNNIDSLVSTLSKQN